MESKKTQFHYLLLIIMTTVSCLATAIDDKLAVTPIKLPARHVDHLQALIELDIDDDGFIELLELSQDELGFAIQQVKSVKNDELLLDWPLIPEWNSSLAAYSARQTIEPVLALLNQAVVEFENKQALNLYYGVGLAEHFRIVLSEDRAVEDLYTAMSLVDFQSISNFTFALAVNNEIEVYNQNYDLPQLTHSMGSNVEHLESLNFVDSLEVNLSVLEENGQLSIIDIADGSVLWQATEMISRYKVGNFDADFNQEILAYSDLNQSFYLYDISQTNPLWIYAAIPMSDYALSDINSDGINEIYAIGESGLISQINHVGQANPMTYQTQNNRFIGFLHYGNEDAPAILTDAEVIGYQLDESLFTYQRQQSAFDQFITADLDLNGQDELISIGKQTFDANQQYIVEVIDVEDGHNITLLNTDFLDFEFNEFDIPVEIGQFDDDENLEIATVFYNGEDDFFKWANEIKIYDGVTFELEKTITFSAFDLWGVVIQLTAADGNRDGIDELYVLYRMASYEKDFDLAEIDVTNSMITWDSGVVLNVEFSSSPWSRVVASNVDDDDSEELIIHYPWSFRIFDLETKTFQLELTNLFSYFSLDLFDSGGFFWTTFPSFNPSTGYKKSLATGESFNLVQFSINYLKYINEIAGDIYLLMNPQFVRIVDKAFDSILAESRPINHSKFLGNNPLIVQSKTDSNTYYIGNHFGYWKVQHSDFDRIFLNGFDN